jgi:hypothetical protein
LVGRTQRTTQRNYGSHQVTYILVISFNNLGTTKRPTRLKELILVKVLQQLLTNREFR